jgi:hypothetical protein
MRRMEEGALAAGFVRADGRAREMSYLAVLDIVGCF